MDPGNPEQLARNTISDPRIETGSTKPNHGASLVVLAARPVCIVSYSFSSVIHLIKAYPRLSYTMSSGGDQYMYITTRITSPSQDVFHEEGRMFVKHIKCA